MQVYFFLPPLLKYLCTLDAKNAGYHQNPEICKPFWQIRKMLKEDVYLLHSAPDRSDHTDHMRAQLSGELRIAKGRFRPCSRFAELLKACPGKFPHLGPS